jgi:alginate O-acetyltransferase complex protein AlgI
MVFTTHIFVFYFLPVLLAVYYSVPALISFVGGTQETVSRARNLWLLFMSYVFYGWWNPWFILLMFFITVVNYLCGHLISRPGATQSQRRFWLTTAIVVSLGTLGFFKYFIFFQANLNYAFGWFGSEGITLLRILLPIGISFYTFQALSYAVDVYRRDAPPARTFADFACYIALFPQMIAGPIMRYIRWRSSCASASTCRSASRPAWRSSSWASRKRSCSPTRWGRSRTPLSARRRSARRRRGWGWRPTRCRSTSTSPATRTWRSGSGRMFGFEFMRNFDAPYRAESITDFWRRWHISLSTFLRDYLYVPLGGNRRGTGRTYANLAIVMLLGGLWHGANWTFIAWGAYHGWWLAFERWLGKQSLYGRLPRPLRVGLTFVLVLFSWVLFRAENLGEAMRYFGLMFGAGEVNVASVLIAAQMYTQGNLILMALAAWLAVTPLQAHVWSERITWPKALAVGPAFALALLAMFAQAFNPFLYFQF